MGADRRTVGPRWVLLGLAGMLLATSSGLGAPPAAPPQARVVSWEVTAVPCPAGNDPHGDGICLGYNGQVPGPTLDVDLLDSVTLTLTNHVAQTVWSIPGPTDVKARLANASVSFHVHGTSLPVKEDGLSAAMGPTFSDSLASPGGSFTYHFRAVRNGTWHYHDHVLGMDGMEGIARGLAGSLVVRAPGEPRPDAVVDVHAMDKGVFASQGGSVAAHGSFELVAVALGDWTWTCTLTDPSGAVVKTLDLGPGQSEHVVVTDALAGSYRWSVVDDVRGDAHDGTVVVQ
jgi:FtsP/CotA-like multicopper oxidase with cupredoxin domain